MDKAVAWLGKGTRFLQPSFVVYGGQYSPRPLQFETVDAAGPLPPNAPVISIVVPSYNQAAFLERTIRCLLEQNYPRLELTVVDGGSSDGSQEILKRYADRLAWWCSEPDNDQAEAINKGFRQGTGELMAWVNSDDMLAPGALARVADFMMQHPEVDLVYGHRILIDELDRDIGRWILPPHDDRVLTWADFIPQETMFWRRPLWDRTGGYLDESKHFAMDWELLLRFKSAGATLYSLPCFLGMFRLHESQKIFSRIEEVGFQEMQQLRARHLDSAPSQTRFAGGVFWSLLKARFLEPCWKAGLVRYA